MGVALAEPGAHVTAPPRSNGGNMDIKQLTAGSTLYLPVWVDGALFSCGDGHAAQGDGEVCITAIETTMTATLRFRVRRDIRLAWPELETSLARPRGRHYATTGIAPDLMEAARQAVRGMIGHLVERRGLSREDAYILSSVAGPADQRGRRRAQLGRERVPAPRHLRDVRADTRSDDRVEITLSAGAGPRPGREVRAADLGHPMAVAVDLQLVRVPLRRCLEQRLHRARILGMKRRLAVVAGAAEES